MSESASLHVALAPLDLPRSTTLQRLKPFDPTARSSGLLFEKSFVGPAGVIHARLVQDATGLAVELHGAGAQAVLDRWRPLLPPDDGLLAFKPAHPLLRRLHRAHLGLRLFRVPWLFDVACGAILQQRVTYEEAAEGFRRIALRHGEKGAHATAFPSAAKLASLPGFELERMGIDPKRSRALLALAKVEAKRPFLSLEIPFPELRERLLAIPGVGPWTSETILGFGAGDTDAAPPGDLHLPHLVSWALAGERRGSDERMMELLEPYRGHRFRVIRLLYAGRVVVPRG